MPHDIDILVIGAGACGLSAAIAAHDSGASVAILEKRDRPGGNSSLSTGSIPGAGTRYQRGAGIEDSPERLIQDLMRIAGETDCPALVRRLATIRPHRGVAGRLRRCPTVAGDGLQARRPQRATLARTDVTAWTRSRR